MTCASCHKNYCIKHRLEADHQCVQGKGVTPPAKKIVSHPKPSARPVSSSSARKPQLSLMSQIGADLNRYDL